MKSAVLQISKVKVKKSIHGLTFFGLVPKFTWTLSNTERFFKNQVFTLYVTSRNGVSHWGFTLHNAAICKSENLFFRNNCLYGVWCFKIYRKYVFLLYIHMFLFVYSEMKTICTRKRFSGSLRKKKT